MDQTLQQFHLMQDLDSYCHNGNFEDMPLGNEFLDGFGMESYQATTPGGLPSPNASNPDLPSSGPQSPMLLSMSALAGGYGSLLNDGSLGADDDPLGSHLPQSQESRASTHPNTCNSLHSTTQSFSNTNNDSSKVHMQQVEPSMRSSSSANAGQNQTFATPSRDPLGISNGCFQSRAATVPLSGYFEQTTPGSSLSTHVPIAPKVMNNTSCTSIPATSLSSPASRPQHFVRHPSTLRHQIHPNQSPSPQNTDGQGLNTMSSHHFTGQVPGVLLSSDRTPLRKVISAQDQNRVPPLLQQQRFQESSLRSVVNPYSAPNSWQTGQLRHLHYHDPPAIFQQQSNCSPYVGNHSVSRSPENTSFMSQGPMDFGFNESSPMSIKREMSSPGSNQVVSSLKSKSQTASPKPQKKRRVRQELKNNDDIEEAIDPVALQTADLTDFDSTDHTNIAALIDAMHNTDNVEDNLGMQKTWEKVRKVKALRIREVCVDLLNLTKLAQQQKGTPLGDKRPINQYASFEKRFDALCETLTFQKTVCKHLIEPPYACSVVDDPHYAKDRVKNNRRVNHQKAEAIRLGREHLGEKGQGKGKPTIKTKKRGRAQMEDSQDDEENSGEESPSDGDTDLSPLVLGSNSARGDSHTSKKTKRSTNSNQNQEEKGPIRTSYLQDFQNFEDPFPQGSHQTAYAPTQMLSEHDHLLHGLVAHQQMPTLNQNYDFQSGNESGNVFYRDRSTGGSDSEGLGGTSYGFN